MIERVKTKQFQKAFLAFFLVLLVFLPSCSKKAAFDDLSAEISPADKAAFNAFAKEIQNNVSALEYSDEVSQDLVKMVSNWKCDLWKQKLDNTKQDYQKKKISADQLSQVEEELVKELYRIIRKAIIYDENLKYFDLNKILRDKKASCFGESQLFYIIGNSIGLKVTILDVLEQSNNSLHAKGGHIACLTSLCNGNAIMVDLTVGFASKAFALKEEFDKKANYWEIKDKNNRLGIHSRMQILDTNGIVAAIYHDRGSEYFKSGKFPEALSYFTKAIDLNPKSALTYVAQGDTYYRMGRYKEAIADFTKSVEINPIYSDVYSHRGSAYDQLGQHTQAIDDYTKAIELNPKDDWAYFNRGITHQRLGRYTEAIADYSKSIELDPKKADAYYGRGIAYYQLKKYTDAISDFDKTIELDPKNAKAYFIRARANGDLRQYMEAIFDFTKVIELDPQKTFAYYGRGLAEAMLGKTEEAGADLQKAVELDPSLKEQVQKISDQFKLGL